ncbi:MAG: hypothetical protein KKC11_09560, partial [Candidatus Omnitrophica bacterium]|nr:hypothetical protein [Candidatus Omnitrophota bacterium]
TTGVTSLLTNLTLSLGADFNLFLGTFNLSNYNLIADSFTQTAGVFNGGSGSVTFNGFSQSAGVFNAPSNLTVNGSGFTQSGGTFNGLTANVTFNDFNQQGGIFNAPSSFTVNGSGFAQTGGTFNGGSSSITFNGFTQTAGTFNAPSGNLYITSTFNRTGGTFNHNQGTVTFLANNSYTITTAGAAFYNVVFNKSGYTDDSRTITLADNFTVANNLTVKNEYDYNYYVKASNSPTITISGNLDFPSTLNAGRVYFGDSANNFTAALAGNFVMADAHIYMYANLDLIDSSKVSAIYGSTTFYNNFSSTAAGKEIRFQAGRRQTIKGNLILRGELGNKIVLKSTVADSKWEIKVSSPQTGYHLDVSDSDALGNTITVSGELKDSGNNNANWIFNLPFYWVAGGNSTWNTVGNWSHTSGGSGGAGVPEGGDYAIFSSGANNCTLDTEVSIDGLGIYSAYSGTIYTSANGYNLVVAAESILKGGSLQIEGGSLLDINGFLSIAGGLLNASAGTIDLEGNLNLSSGTLTAPSSNFSIAGNFTKTGGIFNHSSGKVIFDAITTGKTITSAGAVFNNLEFNGVGGAWTLADALDADGSLAITSGTLTAGSNSINIGGSFTNSGTFNAGTSTIIFDGSGSNTIASAGAELYNLEFNNAGGQWILQQNLDVNNNFILTNGAVNLNGKTLTVGGNFANQASFNHNNGTVIFDDIAKISTISGSTIFYNLTCQTPGKTLKFGAGQTQTITNTLNLQGVSGNLITLRSTQENSAYTLNNLTSQTVTFIDVSDASAANPITANTSKNSGGNNANWAWTITYITWGGNASSNWGQGDNWQYGYVPNESDNVTIGNVTNSPVLGAARTINNLTINSGGVLDLAGNNFALTGSFQNYGILKLEGSETVTIPNMDINSGTVEYYGGGTYTTPLAAGDEYYNLTISGSGSFTAPSSLTINNIFTQTAGTFNASSNLYITNTFNRTAGTFNHNNGTVTFLANNSYTVTTGGVTFYNVVFNKSSYNDHSRTITLADDFTVANNLTVKNDYTSGYHYYVYGSSSPTITVLGNLDFPLTAQAGNVYFGNSSPSNNFTVNLAGNLTMSDTQAYAYARINLAGSGNQTLNQTAGTIYQISSSKTTGQIILGSNFTATTLIADTDTTFDINLATFNFTSAFNQSTGTFTLTPSGTGEITFNGFTQTAGTFNAPSGNLYITSTFNRTGGIFNHNNGTVTFLANNTYNITTGSATFYNVVFNKTAGGNSKALNLYNDFTIANNLTVKNEHPTNYSYYVYAPGLSVITISGNLSFPLTTQTGAVYFGYSSATHSYNFIPALTGNFILADPEAYMLANLSLNGAGDQTITQSAGTIEYGTWTVNKTTGTATLLTGLNLTQGSDFNLTAGTFNCGVYDLTSDAFSQTAGTFNGGSANVTFNGFNQTAGVFNAPSGNLYITSTFTSAASGEFNHSLGTVTFLANNSYTVTTGGVTFYNVVFNKSSYNDHSRTITLADDFTVAN